MNNENRLAATSTPHLHSVCNTFIAAYGLFGALNSLETVLTVGFVVHEYVHIKNM
jgi:hypothetical protein